MTIDPNPTSTLILSHYNQRALHCTMFMVLPSDVLLHILLFLGSGDIARIYILSRGSHKFLVDHESEVYHQLAISCRFALSGCSLKDTILPETHRDSSWLRGADTWKELGRYS
ncbi:hypothetical protein QCA50_007355 [Cerrena zonata]|uniref:F-box domain-containing protein n=1 Tax=Cerrena zonata TaxID=2478898 RepID=A0AAW0G830_9APHY